MCVSIWPRYQESVGSLTIMVLDLIWCIHSADMSTLLRQPVDTASANPLVHYFKLLISCQVVCFPHIHKFFHPPVCCLPLPGSSIWSFPPVLFHRVRCLGYLQISDKQNQKIVNVSATVTLCDRLYQTKQTDRRWKGTVINSYKPGEQND